MTKIFVLFLFLFNILSAKEESFSFIGVTISKYTVDLKSIVTDLPNKLNNFDSAKETTFGIQYGAQTKDYRTTFTLAGNSNFQSIDVELDSILMDEMFGTPKVRPYAGATLGYIDYDEKFITQYNETNTKNISISASDVYYGLSFGFLFYMTDNIDLDVSYHYYFMDRLEPLDTMQGVTFSLHYFY